MGFSVVPQGCWSRVSQMLLQYPVHLKILSSGEIFSFVVTFPLQFFNRRLIKPLSVHLQMDLRFYPQVVRMTRCEGTTGYPEMLRDRVTFLGFGWAQEYQVYEQHREFEQTYYQAIVYILSDDGDRKSVV